MEYDYKVLCHIHKLVADKLVLDGELGRIRRFVKSKRKNKN